MSKHRTIEALEKRFLFTAYYVTATAAAGGNGSRTAPWNLLSTVSTHSFSKGDTVSLTGTFKNQMLTLGSAATGVSVSSNGSSASIVESSTSSAQTAITISASDVSVQGIKLTSSYAGSASVSGIALVATSTAFTGDLISGFTATGFSYGLSMVGNSAGFSNTTIRNSTFSSNTISGIETFVGTSPALAHIHSNLTINGCTASNNTGTLASHSDCGGIFLGGVNGAIVEHCTANDNCSGTYGAVGIWAYQSSHLLFQYDQSSQTQSTLPDADGDGFDFDWGVSDSTMQYDYSHDNQGTGYLICTYNGGGGNGSNIDNTIRYCISDHDGQNSSNSYGGISMSSDSSDPGLTLSGANIYNNTIMMGSPGGSGIVVYGSGTDPGPEVASIQANFTDNIFYTANANPLISYDSPTASSKLVFKDNDYAGTNAAGLDFNVVWAGTHYGTLASWQAATGQEAGSGVVANPELNFPANISASAQFNDLPIDQIDQLELKPTSPLLHAGVAVSGAGMQDFFGDPLVAGSAPDIGANQATLPPASIALRNAGNGMTTIVINSSTIDTVQFWLPIQYTLDISSGSESITIDDSAGNALPSAGMNFCGSSSAISSNTLLLIGSIGNDNFTSASNSLTFDSVPIDYANIGFTYLNPNGGTDALTVTSGTLVLSADASTGAIVPRKFAAFNITGGELFVQPPAVHKDRQVLIVPGNVNLSSKVDLTSNDMIVTGGNWAGIQGNLNSGTYLTTSTTTLVTTAGTAPTFIGVVPNNGGSGTATLMSTFDGQAVAYSDILIKWTYAGDANDSGLVTLTGSKKANDGTLYSDGFNAHLTGWFNGDFNHDGTIDNVADLKLFESGYDNQVQQL